MTLIAPTLQAFFTDRLVQQRNASPNTVVAYRRAFCLVLRFIQARSGKQPSRLDFFDLNAETVVAFLQDLEAGRANTVRSRNARLAAIHSFFRFASTRHPEHAADIQRVLAIPNKRSRRQTSLIWTATRSPVFSRRPIVPLGTAAGTTRYCSSLFRVAFGSQNSPA